jgi:hypothetical protein
VLEPVDFVVWEDDVVNPLERLDWRAQADVRA